MVLETPLDYETTSAYTLTVTCVDAEDSGLLTTRTCDVVVVDVAEAPYLTGWSYVLALLV